ncbi:MAG: MXAN_5187 C-terminal domain-containing protein [Desulfuromonadales bacterium]|nr:MXAN_5187 C-terminal domain-containing protein [Desulfuromonadales bacterium]
MIKRATIEQELNRIEETIRLIDQNYEKYFAGIERRPPEKMRDDLSLELRRFANRYIPQTDLRYRYQMLATRFYSYSGNWERLMKQIEEGKFVRKLERLRGGSAAPAASRKEGGTTPIQSEAERISAEIAAISGKAPDRQKIATLLAEQRAQLTSRFAGREIEFIVTCEDGKPKLKARAKG